MTAERIIALREVAIRLARIRRLRAGKIPVPALLGLLKSGELNAGFQFPGATVTWIPIPTSYWTGISTHKFRSLQYKAGDKHKKGTYEVKIAEFIDEYLQIKAQSSSTESDRYCSAGRQAETAPEGNKDTW